MIWVGWLYLAVMSAYATLSPIATVMLWRKDERALAVATAVLGTAAAVIAAIIVKAVFA